MMEHEELKPTLLTLFHEQSDYLSENVNVLCVGVLWCYQKDYWRLVEYCDFRKRVTSWKANMLLKQRW